MLSRHKDGIIGFFVLLLIPGVALPCMSADTPAMQIKTVPNFEVQKVTENGYKYICEEKIQYVEFTAPRNGWWHTDAEGINSINSFLKPKPDQCGPAPYPYDEHEITQTVTHVTARFVSVLAAERTHQQGSGGSGPDKESHTFDAKTGREYRLKDIVDPKTIAEIKEALIKSIVVRQDRQKNYGVFYKTKEELAAGIREEYSPGQYHDGLPDKELLDRGFHIEGGNIVVDMYLSFYDNGSGNYHPGVLPKALITSKPVLDELNRPKLKC